MAKRGVEEFLNDSLPETFKSLYQQKKRSKFIKFIGEGRRPYLFRSQAIASDPSDSISIIRHSILYIVNRIYDVLSLNEMWKRTLKFFFFLFVLRMAYAEYIYCE